MLDKFKIGHYTDAENGTGVTVILAEEGAVGGVCVRGSAPATRETDLLKSEKTVEKINAVVLSGGSAFGLEASCGVMRYLHERNAGYEAGAYRVPIVTGASVYDLEYGRFAWPDAECGHRAAENARADNFSGGSVGGGTGATVGKMMGMDFCQKSGVGTAVYAEDGLEIAVIVVVNALGDVVDNGKIIAGFRGLDGEFADSAKTLAAASLALSDSNTTIGCVLTNAALKKTEANVIADLAQDGIALAISPPHTRYDGDAMFCMASGEKTVGVDALAAVVPDLARRAILNAVRPAGKKKGNIQMDEFSRKIVEFLKGDGLVAARTISILILGLLAVKIILLLTRKCLIRMKIEKTASGFMISLIGVALYFVLFLGVGKSAGISPASFVVIASAAGLALSLALQDSLGNLANGFIIVGTKPFVVGDYVEIGSVSGSVKSIGIFNTKLVTPDNKVVTIPNSQVTGSCVVNYSANPTRRLSVDFTVRYDTDLEKAKEAVMRAAEEFNEILSAPRPAAVASGYEPSGVKLSFRAWVPSEAYWDVQYALNERLLAALREAGVELAYNTMDVNVLEREAEK